MDPLLVQAKEALFPIKIFICHRNSIEIPVL